MCKMFKDFYIQFNLILRTSVYAEIVNHTLYIYTTFAGRHYSILKCKTDKNQSDHANCVIERERKREREEKGRRKNSKRVTCVSSEHWRRSSAARLRAIVEVSSPPNQNDSQN